MTLLIITDHKQLVILFFPWPFSITYVNINNYVCPAILCQNNEKCNSDLKHHSVTVNYANCYAYCLSYINTD